MLREHKDIDRHTHWSDCKKRLEADWRYRIVDSPSTKEDWFRDYVRILKEERKRDKEREKDHRHREKDAGQHHKTEKNKHDKDKDKESKINSAIVKDTNENGKTSSKDKSSKDKLDKETRDKKQRKSDASSEENGKEPKNDFTAEREIGEIEDIDDKLMKKENDVSFPTKSFFTFHSIMKSY